MNSKPNENPSKNQHDQLIEKALRTTGFLFPETVDEVKEFEKMYGTTDIIMPEELQDLSFLDNTCEERVIIRNIASSQKKAAMAARGATLKLTDEVNKKMASDRRVADTKFNNKDNGTKLR